MAQIRAKSEVKIKEKSGNNATWQFSKGMPLASVLCDLINFTKLDNEEIEKVEAALAKAKAV